MDYSLLFFPTTVFVAVKAEGQTVVVAVKADGQTVVAAVTADGKYQSCCQYS